MTTPIDELIHTMAHYQKPRLFNPWSESCRMELSHQYYLQRRANLKAHLCCNDPLLIILGGASGFCCARFTGVAFTTEQLLFEGGIPRVQEARGQRITTRKLPWKEPAATLVWQVLEQSGVAERTMLFNAVPWHPEGKGGALSNRPPNAVEKNAGLECLALFFALFPDLPVLSLGLTASENLKRLSIEHTRIRHPANGGAALFRSGAKIFIDRCLGTG